MILIRQVVTDLLLDLVKFLLLLFNHLFLLYLFFNAFLNTYTLHFFLVVVYFGIYTLNFGVNLLDDWVYLFDLLLEGVGLGFEMLESRFGRGLYFQLLKTLGQSLQGVIMLG